MLAGSDYKIIIDKLNILCYNFYIKMRKEGFNMKIIEETVANPWFWACLGLSGLMFVTYVLRKVKRTVARARKIIAGLLVSVAGFTNTAVKAYEGMGRPKAEKRTERAHKEAQRTGHHRKRVKQ